MTIFAKLKYKKTEFLIFILIFIFFQKKKKKNKSPKIVMNVKISLKTLKK